MNKQKLIFLLPLILAACASTAPSATSGAIGGKLYRAVPEDTRDLPPEEAREVLIKAVQAASFCGDQKAVSGYKEVELKTVSVTYKKIELTCADSKGSGKERRSFRIAAKPELVIRMDNDLWIPMACISASSHVDRSLQSCMFIWKGGSAASTARDFVRAWHVLAGAVDPVQEAAFERTAQNYRDAQVKPSLPEEAVKYKVQAELAIQQKRFDDAVDLYDLALGVAPWWPSGHYNRGLILGEQQSFQEGIRELQKYLKLEPGAPDARAVQIKIYQWEGLVPRAAK